MQNKELELILSLVFGGAGEVTLREPSVYTPGRGKGDPAGGAHRLVHAMCFLGSTARLMGGGGDSSSGGTMPTPAWHWQEPVVGGPTCQWASGADRAGPRRGTEEKKSRRRRGICHGTEETERNVGSWKLAREAVGGRRQRWVGVSNGAPGPAHRGRARPDVRVEAGGDNDAFSP